MSLTQRFVWGMASGAGSIVIKAGLNILLIPLFIHQLGVEQYGLFVLLLGLSEFTQILDMGFSAALIKVLGTCQTDPTASDNHEILKMGSCFYALITGLAVCLGWMLMPWFAILFHIPPYLLAITKLALTIVLIEGGLNLYSGYYRAVLLAQCYHPWVHLADSLYHILANGIGLLLLLMGFGLPALFMARLGAAILRILLLLAQALKIQPGVLFPKATVRLKTLRQILTLSGQAFTINLSILVSHKIDNFVIAGFLPLTAVGVYEIVFRFLGIALQISSKVCEGMLPMFAQFIAKRNHQAVRQLFLQMSCLSNSIVLLLLLIIVSFYPSLFQLFSSGKIPFQQTIPILIVAIPCIWSGVLQMPAGYYLFAAGRQKHLAVSSIITALCNLGLSLLLVQHLGAVGVALGTLIPQLLQHQLDLIRQTCQDLGISLKEYLQTTHLRLLLPLAVVLLWVQGSMHALQWLLPHQELAPLLMLAVALSAFLLAAVLLYAWALTPQEKALFRHQVLLPLKVKFNLASGVPHGI